jgi:uncharacterized protein with gpF-like domain
MTRRFERERHLVKASVRTAVLPQTLVNQAQIALYSLSNLLEWKNTFIVAWRVTSDYFSKNTEEALRNKYFKSTGPSEVKIEAWDAAVETYINQQVGAKIKYVGDTTLAQIKVVVANGITEGKSANQIAEDLDQLYNKEIIPFRAPVIARTEVSSASNYGNIQAAKSLDMDVLKRWTPILDNRTRPEHAAMVDSDWIPLDQPFEVGGELLDFPGDTSLGASAYNTVNCRCTLYFKPASSEMPYD